LKRPAFMFYPADWRKDPQLGACSHQARGLWFEIMLVMHECEPYGHASIDGRPIDDERLARLCRWPVKSFRRSLNELSSNGVFSRTADGTIYSRRMVRDEGKRGKAAEYGRRGGNPALLNPSLNPPINPSLKSDANPKISPSFAVAVSNSNTPVVVPRSQPTETPHTFPPNGVIEKLKATVKSSPPEDPPETPPARPNGHGQQWSSPAWVRATALLVERPQRPGESAAEWRDAVRDALNARIAAGKAKT